MGVLVICVLVFIVFWCCFVYVYFILMCFDCTGVRTMPPSETSIGVSSNNNNNNNNSNNNNKISCDNLLKDGS